MDELKDLKEIFDFGIVIAKGIADFERSTLDISEVKHKREIELIKARNKKYKYKRRRKSK